MTSKSKKYWESVPLWPNFHIAVDEVDGNIPSTRVNNWRHFQEILNDPFFRKDNTTLVFRGQRRFTNTLTPSIARYSNSGTFSEAMAKLQIDNFRLALRGRIKDPGLQDNIDELWALGQHYGLKTHLLDWTTSPFVALFFAFEKPDRKDEKPSNTSRAIYVLNKTKIERYLSDLFVQPLRNDHSRIINQAGLFSRSPSGEQTLETYLLNTLADYDIDVDSPEALSEYICKIHVPVSTEIERSKCVRILRQMNLHHASLFPDLIGSSTHCNELLNDFVKLRELD